MRLVGTLPDGTEKEIKYRHCGLLKRQDRGGEKCFVTEFIVDGLIKDSVTPAKGCTIEKRDNDDYAVLRQFGFVKVQSPAGMERWTTLFDDTMEKVSG